MVLSGAHFTKSRGSDGADVLQTHLRLTQRNDFLESCTCVLESCHKRALDKCTGCRDKAKNDVTQFRGYQSLSWKLCGTLAGHDFKPVS